MDALTSLQITKMIKLRTNSLEQNILLLKTYGIIPKEFIIVMSATNGHVSLIGSEKWSYLKHSRNGGMKNIFLSAFGSKKT